MKKILFSFFSLLFTINLFSQNWDINILHQINTKYPTNSSLKTISATAEPLTVAIPFGMVSVALITNNKKLELKAYKLMGSIFVTAAITEGLKIAINRARPYETYPNLIYPNSYEAGKSFPSAHTSLAFATATSLFINNKKWYIALPAYGWATSVAYSRLYLGEHYPTDVIAGAIVGAGSAWLSDWLTKKYFTKHKK